MRAQRRPYILKLFNKKRRVWIGSGSIIIMIFSKDIDMYTEVLKEEGIDYIIRPISKSSLCNVFLLEIPTSPTEINTKEDIQHFLNEKKLGTMAKQKRKGIERVPANQALFDAKKEIPKGGNEKDPVRTRRFQDQGDNQYPFTRFQVRKSDGQTN